MRRNRNSNVMRERIAMIGTSVLVLGALTLAGFYMKERNVKKSPIPNHYIFIVPKWIIKQSKGFEDAVRKAVSLGADADTLGAIVGSIAEAIWGIPEDIKVKVLSYLDDKMKDVLHQWKQHRLVKTNSINSFTEKYIDYFLTSFDPESASYYDLFDSPTFPNECRALGFEMDCGESFIAAYGHDAWRNEKELSKVVNKINDMKILGSALFSQWRYFNHWSYGPATEDDKKWFLTILRRMQEL